MRAWEEMGCLGPLSILWLAWECPRGHWRTWDVFAHRPYLASPGVPYEGVGGDGMSWPVVHLWLTWECPLGHWRSWVGPIVLGHIVHISG